MSLPFEQYQYIEMDLDSSIATPFRSNVPFKNHALFKFVNPLENIVAFKIISAQIPFTYYTINDENSTFYLTEENTPNGVFITIPEGNYTWNRLATTLGSLLTTASQQPGMIGYTYTVTFDVDQYSFQITTSNLPPGSTGNFGILISEPTNGGNSLTEILGLQLGLNSSIAGTLFAPFVAQLTGPNYIYLCSDTLGPLSNTELPQTSMQDTRANGPEITMIPVNANPGQVIFYNDNTNSYVFDMHSTFQLTYLDLFFRLGPYSYPNYIDFNGASFSVKIGFWLKRSIPVEVNPKGGGFIRM